MDRIDAMIAFVAVADGGGFSAAARQLGKSPASITRAVAFLEERIGATLMRRTTRVTKLTDAGERYLASCRRILSALAEAEQIDAERAAPRGPLTISAPAMFGRMHVRPIADAYLAKYPDTQIRLLLIDRVVNLIDEGVDVAIRFAHLPDSALVATKVGAVHRVLCASKKYLSRKPKIKEPSDLSNHECISFSQVTPSDLWAFKSPGDARPRQIKVRPRLTVNTADSAIASALDHHGITRVLSYQVDDELRAGRLIRLLATFEPEPLPVHVICPASNSASIKMRAFLDLTVPILRDVLRRR